MSHSLPHSLTHWHLIAPFGKHTHPEGLQIFTEIAAKKMIQHFKSFFQRLKRCFRGLPVYIGHPDHPDFKGKKDHTDSTPYGEIVDLMIKPNGLWAQIKWDTQGQCLIQSQKYQFFSPYWSANPIENAGYEPNQLISLGLTNTPNIRGLHIFKPYKNEHLLKTTSHTLHLRFSNTFSKKIKNYPLLKQSPAYKKNAHEPYLTTWSRTKQYSLFN